eukprot:7721094-Pyramimonas_sp.AAC.1
MRQVTAASPRVGRRPWIDDASQTAVGPRSAPGRFARRKLRVYPKSVVLCSKYEDAVAVARAVRLRSFQIPAARQSTLLGVGFSCGHRCRAMRVKGDSKHKQMSSKIARISRASRRHRNTARLEKAGGQPAGSHGHQVHGMFGQQ